ncbi:MAG: ECF transporter S component [Clostridia bacterium]|nr:ECF transporter S component [Clostridia bacterium]
MNNEKKEKTKGAGVELTAQTPKNGAGERRTLKQRFSAKRLALMGVFVALSYALSWLEIPLFPSAPFLKLDFGNVFILLIGFLCGPVEGVIVCVIKETLRLIGSSSGMVGELANVIMTSSFILLPSIVYQFRKGLKAVIPALVGGCVIGTAVALVVNRFITFPLYMGGGAATVFNNLFWYVLAFNLIKTVSIGILTALLYKKLSNFLKKMKI